MASYLSTPARGSPKRDRWRNSSARSMAKAGGGQAIRSHAIVISWENVLMPLGWMVDHLGLGRSAASIDSAARLFRSSPQLQAALAAVETSVMELLTHAMSVANGPVCIVSELTTAYVEIISGVFFPRLTAALRSATSGIHVLGTPDTELSSRELALWKRNLLHTVCLERLFPNEPSAEKTAQMLQRYASGRVGVVGICATPLDIEAMRSVLDVAPYAVIKTAHVRGKAAAVGTGAAAALGQFFAQLQTLQTFVTQAVKETSAVNIDL